MVKILPSIFSFEEMKKRWNEDNPNDAYPRAEELNKGIYALDKFLIRVDDKDKTISSIGWKEHPTHTVVGALYTTARANPRKPEFEKGLGGNMKALQAERERQINPNKPVIARFSSKTGNQEKWLETARSRGWKLAMDDNFNEVKNLVPEEVIREWSSAYPKGDWGIRNKVDPDELEKWIFADDELPKWWNVVKLAKPNQSTITDNQWLSLKDKILNNEIPVDRNKYVKYNNLSKINKEMVLYYLRLGFTKPKRRKEAYNGILDEMLRSSNERYDIQDKGGQ